MTHAARRVGLILPALNEEDALPLVLAELPLDVLHAICVVDNGSTDRTADVARAAGAHVLSEDRRGYGQACLAGIAWMTSGAGLAPPLGEADVIVFLDADHSDYPEDMRELLRPIFEKRAQFVIGSRLLGGATMGALLPQAWFGNRLACFLMQLLFGARYSDLGPFRAIEVGALQGLKMADTNFGWTVEMQLKAVSLGLTVEEVPVRYRQRIGRSKITGTLWGTLRAGWKILGWIAVWRLKTWLRPLEESPTDES